MAARNFSIAVLEMPYGFVFARIAGSRTVE